MMRQVTFLLWLKLCCCFFFVSLPFSYSLLPEIGHAMAPACESIAGLWGKQIAGIVRPVFLGSDSLGLYLHLITVALLSAVFVWIWKNMDSWRLIERIPDVKARIEHLVNGLLIFFLALHLFKYGSDKLFKHQFYFPEPNTLFTPLGYLTKDMLYWSAVGASYSYNVVLGLVELVPAVLLLFRRTRLLGGLMAAAVLLHVLVLNFAFDISVKIHASMLLLAAITIIAPALPALIRYILRHTIAEIPKGRFKSVWISLGLLVILLAEALFPYLHSGNFHGDKAQKPWLHGAYAVVASAERPTAWKRFFLHSKFYLILQDQEDQFEDVAFRWDWRGDSLVMNLGEKGLLFPSWDEGDSSLRLCGVFRGDSLLLNGKKVDLERLPLAEDGFNWAVSSP
jgi:hypothetical protein